MSRAFTPQEEYMLDIRQSALRLLHDNPDGEKLLEFMKFTSGYYIPMPSDKLQRNEGFRAAVCLLDLFKRSVGETPEAFLSTIEGWNTNWKA